MSMIFYEEGGNICVLLFRRVPTKPNVTQSQAKSLYQSSLELTADFSPETSLLVTM